MSNIRPVSIAVHTWVVSYDVVDDARRRRIARMLESHGSRLQFSLFECRMGVGEAALLRKRVAEAADLECDRVRWYPLCGPCRRKTVRQGSSRFGARIEKEGFLVV